MSTIVSLFYSITGKKNLKCIISSHWEKSQDLELINFLIERMVRGV